MFSLAQQYRYSGTKRDDFAANNAAARAALEKYGELPQDVLEGERRSRFAPPLIRRSPLASATTRSTAPIVVPPDEPDQAAPAVSDEASGDEASASSDEEDASS